ncbi:ATP-binding protein [Thioalkalivibrio sp. ALJ7]|uniref:ATP-binding protein n=1 Tax=Thioalkalivibrio sp. ALJ7 TaxID=1158756 RepID=UPI0012DCF46D|nr:hypothetical protein [Thioalkalivibrio sp. ALJ7]
MSIPIIEIVGAPGAGKTTLLRAVVNGRGLSTRPIIVGKKTSLKQPRRLFRKIPELASRLSVRNRLLERFFLKSGQSFKYSPNLEASLEDWSCYVQHSLGLIHSQKSPWLFKTKVAAWWADTFLDRLALDCIEREGVLCLDDEPLCYRLSLFNGLCDEAIIRRYYELMPLPSAVAHLVIGEDELMHRVKSRERVAARHKGLSEFELQEDVAFSANVANIAREVLGTRGVPVLELDGSACVSRNASAVLSFSKKIAGDGSVSGDADGHC